MEGVRVLRMETRSCLNQRSDGYALLYDMMSESSNTRNPVGIGRLC
jgi:hypothetical protein